MSLDRSKSGKLASSGILSMLHCVIAMLPIRVNLDRSKSKDSA